MSPSSYWMCNIKCCYNAGNREYCKYIMACLLRLAVLSIILILYHRRYLIPAKTSNREFLAMLVLEKLCMTQGDIRRFILRKFLISKKKKKLLKKHERIGFAHAINLNLQGKNDTWYSDFVIGSTLSHQFLLFKSHI